MKGSYSECPRFPPTFIFQSILDISKTVNLLHVVVADGNLRRACGQIPKIRVHESLDDFVKAPECIALLKNQDFSDDLPALVQKLKENKKKLSGQLSSALDDELPGHDFTDRGIPSDGNEASVGGIYDTTDIELDFDNIEYLGGESVLIPFQCTVDTDVDFYIYKSDYYCLSDERMESISTSVYNNDHYFMAQERHYLSVAGKLAVSFDLESLEPGDKVSESLDVMLDEASIEVNEIDDVHINESSDYLS